VYIVVSWGTFLEQDQTSYRNGELLSPVDESDNLD
jgi:hypothetical protein